MILTDADRRRVLSDYRRLRRTSPNSPQTIMRIIRDCAADWVLNALANGAEPNPVDIRQWEVAAEYCASIMRRPDYWRRNPA